MPRNALAPKNMRVIVVAWPVSHAPRSASKMRHSALKKRFEKSSTCDTSHVLMWPNACSAA